MQLHAHTAYTRVLTWSIQYNSFRIYMFKFLIIEPEVGRETLNMPSNFSSPNQVAFKSEKKTRTSQEYTMKAAVSS